MIPDAEIDLLTNTVARAVDPARAGEMVDGHGELVGGLRRAEALPAEADAPDWVSELALASLF